VPLRPQVRLGVAPVVLWKRMARRKRALLPDGIYHLGTRGVDRCTVYVDDDDRRASSRSSPRSSKTSAGRCTPCV